MGSQNIEDEEINQLKNSLPQQPWFNGEPLYFYQGFWAQRLDNVIACQNHFQAQDTDIFLTSIRKAGTTWLKALIFAICNRTNHSLATSPLLTHNPHELVPQFETNTYANSHYPDLINTLKPPRIFGTHIPYQSLPISIKNNSKCKIIYIFRNPFDTLVSSWLFYLNLDDNKTLKPDMLAQYFDLFCQGRVPFGPFEDHALGYWKQSLEQPNKVLFVKYEELKVDPKPQLKRMAEFIGYPISEKEEKTGVMDEIVELCSLEKLKDAAVNGKSARVYSWSRNELFFRKGVTGDWVNYLTPLMADKLWKIMEEKFRGSELTFL